MSKIRERLEAALTRIDDPQGEGARACLTVYREAARADADAADARDRHLREPLTGRLSILAPVRGTETSRRAAEVAIVLARASGCPLTALYVAPTAKKKRARQYEEAILKDIVALADTYEVTLQTAVRANIAPDQAIIKEMARRRHNLVVLGAERRPGEKLYFGDTAAALLEKSEKSLLFVAS